MNNIVSKMLKIGFLGSGKMAQALAKGFIASGITKAENLIASSPPQDEYLLQEFKSIGGKVTHDNNLVTQEADVLILAVKPAAVFKVLESIRNTFTPDHLLVSIAMGVTLKQLEQGLPPQSRVLRAMPNTPAAVGAGASVVCGGSSATQEDIDLGEKLLGAVGTCKIAPESSFDAVTALSGSGPAYIFMLMEALSDGGVKMGLPRDLATHLAVQTTLGAASMAANTGVQLAALREQVTSPAGSTAAGLHELEKGSVRGSVTAAVEAATKRCKEVSNSKH